jgi:predicted NAD/FAD-binding protein
MHNHHLLQISGRPQWLTIKDGAKRYIESVINKVMKDRVHVKTPVSKVVRRHGKVFVTSGKGEEEFDHVIFATHADTSLKLLAHPTANEQSILGDFEFSKNVASLHTDISVVPP